MNTEFSSSGSMEANAACGIEVPKRIQLSRAKGWKMPANTVKVDRSTPYGNPFQLEKGSLTGAEGRREGWFVGATFHLFERREDAQAASVKAFSQWIRQWPQHKLVTAAQFDLRGKNLACWCKPGTPCHADVLLELANCVDPLTASPLGAAK